MRIIDPAIVTFPARLSAGPAKKKLTAGGFVVNSLSIIDEGFCTDEKTVGYFNAGDGIHEIRP